MRIGKGLISILKSVYRERKGHNTGMWSKYEFKK